MALKASSNPFGDPDADYSSSNPFSSSANDPYKAGSSYNRSNTGGMSIHEQIQQTQNKALESQVRSLQKIAETEKIGQATAEELMEQGEKLRNTNERLDNIGAMQKQTQSQINTLKSFWGGMFSRKKKGTPDDAPVVTKEVKHNEELSNAINQVNTNSSTQYAEIQRQKQMNAQSNSVSNGPQSDFDRQFDANLDLMGHGLQNLHGLAKGLNQELKSQNQLLDEMAPKIDSTNARMESQQKQLDQILGGNKKKKF